MQWEPQGSPNQKQIVYDALQRCTFDFGQIAQDRVVPVEWENLSRYYSSDAKQITEDNHVHLANGDVGHPIEARARVLGLAWYSGKISLDLYCEPRPDLAHEVFLSEGAHMLDFFWDAGPSSGDGVECSPPGARGPSHQHQHRRGGFDHRRRRRLVRCRGLQLLDRRGLDGSLRQGLLGHSGHDSVP
jgi:hypothetical protein